MGNMRQTYINTIMFLCHLLPLDYRFGPVLKCLEYMHNQKKKKKNTVPHFRYFKIILNVPEVEYCHHCHYFKIIFRYFKIILNVPEVEYCHQEKVKDVLKEKDV